MDMTGTIKELADKLSEKTGQGIDKAAVGGYVRVMVAMGKARVVGKGKKPTRGRSPVIYELDLEG